MLMKGRLGKSFLYGDATGQELSVIVVVSNTSSEKNLLSGCVADY